MKLNLEVLERVVNELKEIFTAGKKLLQKVMISFEMAFFSYSLIQGKRQPSKEQAFLSISGDLQVMNEHLEVMESKLSFVQDGIRILYSFLLSTIDLVNLFLHVAFRVINELQEVMSEILASRERVNNIKQAIKNIRES